MSRVSFNVFFWIFLLFMSIETYSQKFDTICSNAGIFCSAESMVGPWELPDTTYTIPTFKICSTAGQSQNAIFFAFVPNSTTVKIKIIPISITPRPNKNPTNIGYQYGIVDRCDFNDPDIEYMDCDGSAKITMPRTVQASNFIPGHTYYLYVDGYEGAKVKFKLDVLAGIGGFVVDQVDSFAIVSDQIDTIAKGDTIVSCIGSELMIEALGADNAQYYEWQTQDTIEMSDSSKLSYKFNIEKTVYKVCATSMTDCDIADSSCFFVIIDTLETVVLDTAYICKSALLTSNYIPNGWHGGAINNPGTYYYIYQDTIGCKVKEQVTVNEVNEPVIQYDSIICDSDLFSPDTLLRDTFIDGYGCKAYYLKHVYYFDFKGFVTELTCSNDTFKIGIDPNGFDRSNYSNILVEWYNEKNEIIKTSFSFDPLIVKKSGTYYPVVTVYQSNKSCEYTLNDTEIKSLPSAEFSINKAELCSSDTLYFELDNYIDTLSYDVKIDGGTITELGGGKYFITWDNNAKGDFNLTVKTNYKDCAYSDSKTITVQEQITVPVLDCVGNTNNSVIIAWDSTGCVDYYEIWIDSKFYHTTDVAHDTIKGLTYGQKIGIEIKAISGCECESKSYQDSCSTINCPERVISIDNLPGGTCFDDLDDSTKLTFISDTTGESFWIGDVISKDGIIYKDSLNAGDYDIEFKFKVGDCSYKIDTTFTIFPKLDVDFYITDISCYNTSDGVLEINPVPDLKDYALMLNETEFQSLIIDSLSAGEYNFVLTDSNGCNFTAGFTLEQPDEPVIEIIGDKKIKFNTDYKYYLDLDNIKPDSVYWYKGDSLICSNQCDTILLNVGVEQPNFELCALMFFDSLCDVETCREIKIDRKFDIYIPNIFTPNFDKINDNFTFSSTNGLSIKIKTFRIYDRWGEELFYDSDFIINTPDSYSGWNGLVRGEKAANGVYVYYIEAESDEGEITKYYGDFTLIR